MYKRFLLVITLFAGSLFGQVNASPGVTGGASSGSGATSVGFSVNSGSTCGAQTISGSPVTTSGTLNDTWAGTNGDIVTFNSSGCPQDSSTLLSSLAPLASPTLTGTVNAAAVTLSGLLTVPVSTASAPAMQATGAASNTGIYTTTTNLCWLGTGSLFACLNSSGTEVGNVGSLAISNTASAAGAQGLGISATVGGGTAIGFDTTTKGNEAALVRLGADPCRITSAVTMNVSGTAVTFCSWSLPAVAKTWAWQCSGTYTTTTATDTLSLGINASQTPTSETGNAIIYSTLTGTSTAGSTTATAMGNQNILTGASVSNVISIPFTLSGTLQASATAGTFALTGTLTGTSPSGTINVGTSCFFL